MPKIMSHPYCPGKLAIKAKPSANGGGDGGYMQAMLHPGANMIVAWSKEHLSLMLQSPEWGGMDDSRGISIIRTTNILRFFNLSSFER